ncbi:hypothetical protein GGR95_003721 [Sulfitobacter undariae]|uniref:Uncharacterized protein n=1 Tax=Sulfitobacter undariae TaxID=1563671 RepID=A0A7W6E7B1_9RHOB|nr:hypothetical protein [Sulfitobacter undariae]
MRGIGMTSHEQEAGEGEAFAAILTPFLMEHAYV